MLPWIEMTVPIQPLKTFDIWHELYASIRENKPFSVRLEEVLAIMKVISAVKEGTKF